jgi:predicted PurR-regulated permease PerM
LVVKGIRRGFAVVLVYLIFAIAIALVAATGLHPTIQETSRLIENFPILLEQAAGISPIDITKLIPPDFAIARSGNVLDLTLGLFSNILFLISILVFNFYLLTNFEEAQNHFLNLFPDPTRKRVKKLLITTEHMLANYVRGQLLLGLIIGVITYLGLWMLDIPYRLSLAVFAGVLEMVPVIGPIISAIPALIVAVSGGIWVFGGVAILYAVVQQVENNLLVPKVMQKSVGINPMVTLLILLTGGKLFGLVGVILGIPSALFVYLFLMEFGKDLKQISQSER